MVIHGAVAFDTSILASQSSEMGCGFWKMGVAKPGASPQLKILYETLTWLH